MAEPGTFKGELSRGWGRFWGLPWKWKGPILVVAAFVILGAIGAATDSGEENPTTSAADDEGSATSSAPTQATATTTAEGTRAVEPSPTATPTEKPPTPTSTPTPVPTFEERVLKSYRDNRGFMTRAVGDKVQITWLPELGGLLKIDVTPDNALSEGDLLTIEAHSAIVASKAIWTTYPEVQQLQVSTLVEFTSATGAKTLEPAAVTVIERATGEQFVYDGLKERALQDNKLWFCGANAYTIHPAIYREIENKGCLATWGLAK